MSEWSGRSIIVVVVVVVVVVAMRIEDRQQHRASAANNDDGEEEDGEEEKSVFRPYTRESLIESEARIAEEEAKRNERKKKREEGEVNMSHFFILKIVYKIFVSQYGPSVWSICCRLLLNLIALKY